LTASIIGTGQAAHSALAEVLPHAVQAGAVDQAFTAFLLPTIIAGDAGVDRVLIHLPKGYGTPAITGVRVAGLPAAYSDASAAGTAEAKLGTAVQSASLIEVQFRATVPSDLDLAGSDLVTLFDNSGTPVAPQVAVQGNANGITDGETWRVTVGPGPVARITVKPDGAVCWRDSTLAFVASAEDAFGNPTGATMSWTSLGGGGTIGPATGVFTGTAEGTGLVVAESGGVRDTASVVVRPVRALRVVSVAGPDSLVQGRLGAAFAVLLSNPGADSIAVDAVSLVFTHSVRHDADADYVVTVALPLPRSLASGDSLLVPLSVNVDRQAATGPIVVDGSASAVEIASGIRVSDDGATTTHSALVVPGGITVAAAQTGIVVRPGARTVPLLAVTITNQEATPRTLVSLDLKDATTGPGTQDQLDSELGDLTLYLDDGDGQLDPARDPKQFVTVGVDGGEATLAAADRPRASRLAGPRDQRVVASLAVRASDRVDRRQVDDVEPHRRDPLQPFFGIAKRGAAVGRGARAREHLVPGGEARPLAVDDDLELSLGPRRLAPVDVTCHELDQRRVAGEPHGLRAGGPRDAVGVGRERAPVGGVGCPRHRAADERQSCTEGAGQLLVPGLALLEVGEPRAVRLGERLDGVDVAARGRQGERTGPAVVVDVAHRALAPGLVAAPISQEGDEHVVAFLEDVGGDLQLCADLALDRVAAAVDGGRDGLDDDGTRGRVDRPRAHGWLTRRD
jgi:hypothetical protein